MTGRWALVADADRGLLAQAPDGVTRYTAAALVAAALWARWRGDPARAAAYARLAGTLERQWTPGVGEGP
jgi:predicted protein tyrosine phosphatase